MDKNWIDRAVNTKGRPCPLKLGDPCPGSRDGCSFWLQMVLKSQTGESEIAEGCSYVWMVPMLHEVAVESRLAQAAAQRSTTLFAQAAKAIFQNSNDRAIEIAEGAERRARALNIGSGSE